ncbi:MAG: VOC family protein [Bacteroidota bacterium]
MQAVQRLLTNLCVSNLSTSKAFYLQLFDLKLAFDSDWFVQLANADQSIELGLIDKNHELVPSSYSGPAGATYLTWVIEDVDQMHEQVKSMDIEIVAAPADTFYGQRRMLIKDPDGILLDLSSLMATRPDL